eukprot:Gregarina_sp_Pseudo_9__4342@NODE_44_length_5141_cov_31_667385_g41_i0_p2_GENE_NODE_44_length_5141_cov_31_667385_g41_i0NODE_44_length_5141_cov_31_667385_g41_i0_p2_ORF_typecomplete_len480_score85_19AGTRAP/PF06396_11/1_1e04AGTRAP/PF06396_11/0_0127TM_GPCR_Sra/PF02117_16/0_05DUF4271/PF14093_6/0_19DUF3294/PF07957_11/1_3e02DUF3294/PF07957_11/2_3e03DUF3294/PF07957_11/3_3_NODE_44_length_5141_cov_31_667385_g41_i02811720
MADSVTRAFLEAKSDGDPLDAPDPAHRGIQFGATTDMVEELAQRRTLNSALGLDENSLERTVSLQDILLAFSALYRKEGRVPDSSLFKALYADTQKSDPSVTWRGFLHTVFKQRRELKNKIVAYNNELKQIDNNVDYCEKQLKDIVSSTSPNSQLEEERLIVQILSIEFASAESVSLLSESLFKVTLDCHGQFSSTASRPVVDNQIFFNEMHAFSLPRAEGDLEFTIHAMSAHTSLGDESTEPIGTGVEALSSMGDQLKHRLVVNFSGPKLEGKVITTLQWIKSKISFYERHVHHYAIQRNALVRDMQEVQSKLDFLELSIFRTTSSRKSNAGNPLAFLVTAVKQPDLLYSWAVDKVLVSVNASNYEKATQAIVGLALVFNCLTSFTRVLYLDSLAEGYAFWCNLDPAKRWTASKYNRVALTLVGSIAFDIIWLYYNVRIFRSPESDLAHLTTVLSILNMIMKMLLIVFLCHARSRLRS